MAGSADPVVLVGGGHAHIEVLRQAAGQPFPVPLVLIEPHAALPYTGMVPGFIAGQYQADDILIDLETLCVRAGARRLPTRACGIDPFARRIECEDGHVVDYARLSIDVGSVLDVSTPGVIAHACAVRPLQQFVSRWPARRAVARAAAVVGAGAAGVEIALALRAALPPGTPVTLVGDSDRLAPGWPHAAATALAAICRSRGIALRLGRRVAAVTANEVIMDDGAAFASDTTIWATGPAAPPWLQQTALALDARGYLQVGTDLRVSGMDHVFAAGDVAAITGHPRPKAGVYAVRAAPVLADNLRRSLAGAPLRHYRPQRQALALLGTGDRSAIGTYANRTFSGRWVWRWKTLIDRRFVARYRRA